MRFIKHLKKDVDAMFATKITQNIKTLITPVLATCLLSGCAAIFGNQPVSVEKVKADDKHRYFVLGSDYNHQLMELAQQANPKTSSFAPAMFEVKWFKPEQTEPQTRTYPYRQANVYPINLKQGSFQLTRIGSLANVRSRLVYECQTIGVPGAPGSTRLCGNKTVYDAEYAWQDIKNAPVVTIDAVGVYLYGNTLTSVNQDAAYQALIESLKSKAQMQKLNLTGF